MDALDALAAGIDLDGLHADAASIVRDALREWMPSMAQSVLDKVNATVATDAEWMEDDDIAGHCESLAVVARVIARMGQGTRHRMTAKVLQFPQQPGSLTCRVCPAPAAVVVYPHVDHRRRKPWPEPFGVCAQHRDDSGTRLPADIGER